MDDRKFDSLARLIGMGASRRTIFKGLIGLGGATLVGGAAAEQVGASGLRKPITTAPPPACQQPRQMCGGQCCQPRHCHDGLCCDPPHPATAVNCGGVCCDSGLCTSDGTCCEPGAKVCGVECCQAGAQCSRNGNQDFCCGHKDCDESKCQICMNGACVGCCTADDCTVTVNPDDRACWLCLNGLCGVAEPGSSCGQVRECCKGVCCDLGFACAEVTQSDVPDFVCALVTTTTLTSTTSTTTTTTTSIPATTTTSNPTTTTTASTPATTTTTTSIPTTTTSSPRTCQSDSDCANISRCTLYTCSSEGVCQEAGLRDCGTCATCNPETGCQREIDGCAPCQWCNANAAGGYDCEPDEATVGKPCDCGEQCEEVSGCPDFTCNAAGMCVDSGPPDCGTCGTCNPETGCQRDIDGCGPCQECLPNDDGGYDCVPNPSNVGTSCDCGEQCEEVSGCPDFTCNAAGMCIDTGPPDCGACGTCIEGTGCQRQIDGCGPCQQCSPNAAGGYDCVPNPATEGTPCDCGANCGDGGGCRDFTCNAAGACVDSGALNCGSCGTCNPETGCLRDIEGCGPCEWCSPNGNGGYDCQPDPSTFGLPCGDPADCSLCATDGTCTDDADDDTSCGTNQVCCAGVCTSNAACL